MIQRFHLRPRVLVRALGLVCTVGAPVAGLAQATTSVPAVRTLDTVVITANPLGSARIAAPYSKV